MMMRAFVLVAALVAACDPDPSSPVCDGQGSVTGGVIAGRTDQVVDKDLVIRGVAADSKGLTIRRVLVAGIPATNDGFNFETWSATLPIDLLAGLARMKGAAVSIKAEAIDACEQHFTLDAFTVQVDTTPGVRVTQLAIAPAIAGGLDFIPANGAVAAILTLTANADAAHAVVSLAASAGTFTGITGNQVTLQGDGIGPATATVLFSAAVPSSQAVLITASAKGTVTSTAVRVAGAPTLIPGSATLAPNQSVAVTVITSGVVQACQATPTTGLTITSGGKNLMSDPTASDTNIIVKADATLPSAVTSTVTCRDPYGQFATAVYRVEP